jgi:hypothetical protein
VDVDDTLILWPKVAESRHLISGDEAKPNRDVMAFVYRWRNYHRDGKIIVWSLGGRDYARKWAYAVFGSPAFFDVWDKEPIAVEKGDMFIDDDPLSFYRERTIHPDMLIGLAPELVPA